MRVECENCSWQGNSIDTDAGFCRECGGECFETSDDDYLDEEDEI